MLDQEQQAFTRTNRSHVIAPERGPSVTPQDQEHALTPEVTRKPRRGLIIGLTGGLAGAALAASAIIGINVASQPPHSEPVAEAPADPSEVIPEVTEPGELLPADMNLEIPAGLSAEELGQAFIDRYNAWGEAGSNNAAINDESSEASGRNVSMGDFVTGKAQEFAPYFADALFVSDWQDRPDLVDTYDALIRINAHRLELNIKTSNPAYGDEEAWSYVRAVDAVNEITSDGTTRTLEIDFIDTNNADKNRVGEDFALEDAVIAAPRGTWTVTFETIDGTERMTANSIR